MVNVLKQLKWRKISRIELQKNKMNSRIKMEVHVIAMERAKEEYNELTGAKHNGLDLLRVRNTE